MFISKFWFTLLTLFMGAAIAVLLLARHSHNLALEEDTRRLLLKDREQAWALLKSEARVRLDELFRISSNEKVMQTLAKASRTPDKLTSDDRTALSAELRRQNEELGSFAGDLLVAVDHNGYAVAQVWEGGPQKANYGLGGFPAVRAALRGFLQDDVWALSTNGANPEEVKVYRIATRPVIVGGQYVGAIVHGQSWTKSICEEENGQRVCRTFADRLARRLGAQVIFFRGPVVLSSGAPGDGDTAVSDQVVISEVDRLLEDESFLVNGQSQIEPVGGNAVALYSLIQGEAALIEGSRVGYAIVRPVPAMESSLEFLTNATLEEWGEMASSPSGIILFISVFLALVIGFLAFTFEHGRPLKKLRREVQRLANREIDRLNVFGVARKHRGVAEAVNTAMDKAVADVAEKMGKKPADIDQILGPSQPAERSGVSASLFSFPDSGADDVPPPPPAAGPQGQPAPRGAPAQPARPAGAAAPVPPGTPGGPGQAPPGRAPQAPAPQQPQPSPPLGGAKPPIPQGAAPGPGPSPRPPTPQGAAPAPGASPKPPIPQGAAPGPAARPQGSPKPPPPAASPRPMPQPAAPPGPAFGSVPSSADLDDDDDEDDRTEIAGVPEELLMASSEDGIPEDEETYFRQIFDKFVETKRQCGERTDNLQFERFSQTLRRNRDALIDRYGCKSVRFQVYVKEGKAALKASPVRN